MKVFIIGSGGREHALAWKLKQSPHVDEIYATGQNAGLAQIASLVDIDINNYEELAEFAEEKEIDLTIVGPEDPLCGGIVDVFNEKNLKIFGPNKEASRFEKSKEFTKAFLKKYNIPTANYQACHSFKEAMIALDSFTFPLVIKADGLCLGKGVIICENKEQAIKTLEEIFLDKIFGEEGNTVVIEDFLSGEEASLLCFVSNNRLLPMQTVQDHKKIFDGEKGPNTGGVGAFSPGIKSNEHLTNHINLSLKKIEEGLKNDGFNYYGILFIGFMIENDEAKILEFNVRFGDPETEVLMPRLKSDLFVLLEKTLDGSIEPNDILWESDMALTTVLCSGGYPSSYEKGKLIHGIEDLPDDIIVFHNGTKIENGNLLTNGGRVLSVTSLAPTISESCEKVYKAIDKIKFENMYYRKDIGKKG